MRKEGLQTAATVLRLRGDAMEQDGFENSVYAVFWQEASRAIAISRAGRVHLVRKVDLGVLRALHQEACGGESAGKMPIALVCQDFESLAGPMLRGISRDDRGWRMGDGSLVRFFEEMPGDEEGEFVPPVQLELSDKTQAEMRALEAALAALAEKTAAHSG
jgi:hypothetical protein